MEIYIKLYPDDLLDVEILKEDKDLDVNDFYWRDFSLAEQAAAIYYINKDDNIIFIKSPN